ncbi:triose-phosphate isomerase [Ectothiorhodospira lacustris]|uniref:triose-phosphate isomerase n=1 Tax=Ectothiorhodospira lacustris TaxID=2899127 RepID=UPI001EE78D99|nr:triose-phosphate isomerase [Ectothiorhodospira lacustris]MCG5508682.1 triose-phosphate isomerase [Ectothiorhodospira lacustris]MCG5520473.1 triose-phosphate isomerase [Ectothiorhodospira lacustris]
MRRPLVAGNWKLNGSRNANQVLMQELVGSVSGLGKVDVAVCPPFVYLEQVAGLCRDGRIALGAQDVSDQDSGAFTGEVSGDMLRDMGCTCVIVGHSERRALYGEDDAFTARKFAAARRHGLTPILCVGELLEEREGGVTESVVARQLDAVLERVGIEALADAVIAYEPVWAIGTGRTATPEQAQAVHAFIRARLADRDPAVAQKVRILYGGSVKADNAAELFAQPDIDGGLIGGASLKASDFLAICKAAEQAG